MEKAAAERMGESVLAASVVATPGEVRKAIVRMGLLGAIGGAVAGALAGGGRAASTIPTPGGHVGLLYMAVGPSKVAFFAFKQGFFKNTITDLLVEHAREDVVSMQVQPGVIPKLQLVLGDGTSYSLECARILLGKVQKMQEVLATNRR